MLDVKVKALFFDRGKLERAADRGNARALSKAGAFIRTRARSSLRSRKRISEPGQPPSSHSGVLKRFVLFARDESGQSVVIGPAKTNQVFFDKDRKPVRGTVPQVLEFGGQITIFEVFKNGRWQRADLRSRRGALDKMRQLQRTAQTRYRMATLKPRPFMGPALEEEREHLPEAWAGVIHGE